MATPFVSIISSFSDGINSLGEVFSSAIQSVPTAITLGPSEQARPKRPNEGPIPPIQFTPIPTSPPLNIPEITSDLEASAAASTINQSAPSSIPSTLTSVAPPPTNPLSSQVSIDADTTASFTSTMVISSILQTAVPTSTTPASIPIVSPAVLPTPVSSQKHSIVGPAIGGIIGGISCIFLLVLFLLYRQGRKDKRRFGGVDEYPDTWTVSHDGDSTAAIVPASQIESSPPNYSMGTTNNRWVTPREKLPWMEKHVGYGIGIGSGPGISDIYNAYRQYQEHGIGNPEVLA